MPHSERALRKEEDIGRTKATADETSAREDTILACVAQNTDRILSAIQSLEGRVTSIEGLMHVAQIQKELDDGMHPPPTPGDASSGDGCHKSDGRARCFPETRHVSISHHEAELPLRESPAKRRPSMKGSLWINDEEEFRTLIDDHAVVDRLVYHLQATQAHFEKEEGRKANGLISKLWQGVKQRAGGLGLDASKLSARLSERLQDVCLQLRRAPDGASGTKRTLWDLVQTCLVISSLVLIPLRLARELSRHRQAQP